MAIAFADRLAWAQEQFEQELVTLEVSVSNLCAYADERSPHHDDEDDALMAAADALRFAERQVQAARKVLEEGC
jgi:hypothetical protein